MLVIGTVTGMTRPEHTPAAPSGAPASDARALTDTVSRLRRVLRTSIRSDYPWESLPMAKVEVMQLLAEIAPARIGDLAARLNLSPSTVSGLVSQMITAGQVERGTDRTDRRVAVVELTPAGAEQLAQWTEAHERRIAAALEKLPQVERSVIVAALPALAHLVDELGDLRREPAAPAEQAEPTAQAAPAARSSD